MLGSFFTLAAVSPSRQRVLRGAAVAHLVVLAYGAWLVLTSASDGGPLRAEVLFASLLVTLGVVEGAVLIGWRLTQLPKSQALEFLLITPLQAPRVLLAEAAVGTARLGLVTLAGLPVLVLLAARGKFDAVDCFPLLVMPFTWGAVAGLALTVWSYETRMVRRWGERFAVVMLLLYLVVGVLAGENLGRWLEGLAWEDRQAVLWGLRAFHDYNPFGVARLWFTRPVADIWPAALAVELAAAALGGFLLWRGAGRLKGHFQDRHYRPVVDPGSAWRTPVSEQPLTWWAVRRVGEFSGRINLWMAGGFCLLYAAYHVAGDRWPAWMGRRVFEIADNAGGIPVLAAGLVVLAAVPAAFQYGLWDSNAQDRCRRLELLLLTRLEPLDYWRAAAAAAWRHGRGYLAVAALLWGAAVAAGQVGPAVGLAAAASAVILWGLYFALGFRDFSRGRNAHTLGLVLTLGLPVLTCVCAKLEWQALVAWLPPGSVYAAARGPASWTWLGGVLGAGCLTLLVARASLARCDGDLRRWYDEHSGRKVLD